MDLKPTTTSQDLLAIVEFFASHNVPILVHGGWALQALTGHSRPHEDVDLLAPAEHRQSIRQLAKQHIIQEAIHKFELNFDGALVDLTFVDRRSNGKLFTQTPRILVIWDPTLFSQGYKGKIDGKEIPVVGPRTMFVEISNKVRKKGKMLGKNAKDLERLEPLLSAEDKQAAQAFFPRENTFWNRLRLSLGF